MKPWMIELSRQYEEHFKEPAPKSLWLGRHWPDHPDILVERAIATNTPIEYIPDDPDIVR